MPSQRPAAAPAAEATTSTHALKGLAGELAARGWVSRLYSPVGRPPSLYVQNPDLSARMLSEHIYAGPGKDGTWAYWWPWRDKIALAGDVSGAASTITRVLRAAASAEETG
jgi:hypothetical protein